MVVRAVAARRRRHHPAAAAAPHAANTWAGSGTGVKDRTKAVPPGLVSVGVPEKPKKLPAETASISYDLEYGQDTLEIHRDAIGEGQRVIIADDLLATGGTAKAVCELVENLGGKVEGLVFVVELEFLPGRSKLEGYDVRSLIKYQS